MSENLKLNDILYRLKTGNTNAKDEIIENYLYIVLDEINAKFNIYSIDGLVLAGIMGLINAAFDFNGIEKKEFDSFARKCIDEEILMYLSLLKEGKSIENNEILSRYFNLFKDNSEYEKENNKRLNK